MRELPLTTLGGPGAPASALQYAQTLLEAQSDADLRSLTVYLHPDEFRPGTNSGAFLWTDYTNRQLVFYHPLYAGSNQTATLSSAHLSPAGAANLAHDLAMKAPLGHEWASQPLAAAALDAGLTLIILGAAEIAAGILLNYFAPGVGSVLGIGLIKVGIATLVLGAVVEAAGAIAGDINSIFKPEVIASQRSPDGTTCNTYSSAVGGCVVVCLHPDGTTTSAPCGGGPSALGAGLLWTAVGLAGVLAVVIGGYVAYRYVSGRPRPGFGNAPSRSAIVYRSAQGVYRDVKTAGYNLTRRATPETAESAA